MTVETVTHKPKTKIYLEILPFYNENLHSHDDTERGRLFERKNN